MTKQLDNLITALRDELQQYGEMLALLERQQDADNFRVAEDLLLSICIVNAQSLKIQNARGHRQNAQRELAASIVTSDCAVTEFEADRFAALIPRLPEEYRPLVGALVEENNELLVRVRQRARQNQILFRRSMETLQCFLGSLTGAPQTTQRTDGIPSTNLLTLTEPLCGVAA